MMLVRISGSGARSSTRCCPRTGHSTARRTAMMLYATDGRRIRPGPNIAEAGKDPFGVSRGQGQGAGRAGGSTTTRWSTCSPSPTRCWKRPGSNIVVGNFDVGPARSSASARSLASTTRCPMTSRGARGCSRRVMPLRRPTAGTGTSRRGGGGLPRRSRLRAEARSTGRAAGIIENVWSLHGLP